MIPPRLRAGLVIGAVAIASGIAGAAIDRALVMQQMQRTPRGGGEYGRRPSPEQEGRRRTEMLDKMTRELSLTPAQRVALDSVFQRTDSSLRALRREGQARAQQVFDVSRAQVEARLEPAQREKFAKLRFNRPPREGRGGGRGSRGADSAH